MSPNRSVDNMERQPGGLQDNTSKRSHPPKPPSNMMPTSLLTAANPRTDYNHRVIYHHKMPGVMQFSGILVMFSQGDIRTQLL
jgi:hypothetical protein